MLSSSRRPMSADERVLVSQLLQPRPFDLSDLATGCLRFVLIPLAGIAVGALVYVGVGPLLVDSVRNPNLTLGVCMALGFLGSIVFLWRDARSGRSHFRDPLERQVMQDLADGEVEVLSATATRAIAVEGTVEHDPGIFLDVEPEKLLFLQGSYLKDVMGGAKPPFPCTAFALVRLPHSHITLRVEPAGEPFRFARMRRPLDPALEYHPDDGELLPASLDTLEADLARQP